jgi:hypothetical protein
VQHRLDAYAGRGDRPRVPLNGRTAVIVDDGIATGSTARAACQIARAHGAARVVLAVPVAPREAVHALSDVADEVVFLRQPVWFQAVGQFYDDFTQTGDDEVTALLDQAVRAVHSANAVAENAAAADDPPAVDDDVTVGTGELELAGRLTVPPGAPGLVLFAHGSGSSRHSPRNRYVADILHRAGLGTLLFDLLTVDEETDRGNVFDIELLAAGCFTPPAGFAGSRSPPICRSGCSAPAPGLRLRCGRPPNRPRRSQQWCPAAAAQTWVALGWARFGHRPCSSSAASTTWSST